MTPGFKLPLQSLRKRLLRLPYAEEGAAAVEFALILPLMLLLYLGSIELSDVIAVDRRVTTIAGTVGDLVARSDGGITTATLNDYFDAAEMIMIPYNSSGLIQVVTCVYVNAAGVTSVLWSRQDGGGTAHTAGQPYPLPTAITDIARDTYVIVSETTFPYRPLLGMVITNTINLYRENFHLPRYGEMISIS